MSIKTVVQLVTKKPVNGRNLYSFKGQDGVWYNTKARVPPDVGTFIEFEANPDARGYLQAENIVILPATTQAVASGPRVAAAAVQASKHQPATNKEQYWLNKEERDITTQKVIELQSCRNSALAFISQLLQVEATALPKAKAEREEFMVALLQRYTKMFLDENQGRPPEVPEEAKEETVSVAPAVDESEVWS